MLALLTHAYARVIHTNSVFFAFTAFTAIGHPLKILHPQWMFSFTHNSLFDKEINKSVKEVKEKTRFARNARAYARGFSLPDYDGRALLFPQKRFSKM